jgi:hypothetical protein
VAATGKKARSTEGLQPSGTLWVTSRLTGDQSHLRLRILCKEYEA